MEYQGNQHNLAEFRHILGGDEVVRRIEDTLKVTARCVRITDGMLTIEFSHKKYPKAWGWTCGFPEWRTMDDVQLAIDLTMMICDGRHDYLYHEAIAEAEIAEHEASTTSALQED